MNSPFNPSQEFVAASDWSLAGMLVSRELDLLWTAAKLEGGQSCALMGPSGLGQTAVACVAGLQVANRNGSFLFRFEIGNGQNSGSISAGFQFALGSVNSAASSPPTQWITATLGLGGQGPSGDPAQSYFSDVVAAISQLNAGLQSVQRRAIIWVDQIDGGPGQGTSAWARAVAEYHNLAFVFTGQTLAADVVDVSARRVFTSASVSNLQNCVDAHFSAMGVAETQIGTPSVVTTVLRSIGATRVQAAVPAGASSLSNVGITSSPRVDIAHGTISAVWNGLSSEERDAAVQWALHIPRSGGMNADVSVGATLESLRNYPSVERVTEGIAAFTSSDLRAERSEVRARSEARMSAGAGSAPISFDFNHAKAIRTARVARVG